VAGASVVAANGHAPYAGMTRTGSDGRRPPAALSAPVRRAPACDPVTVPRVGIAAAG
jgi:hypothetical protein